MKVYNQDKTTILNEYDLTKGYLKEDKILKLSTPKQEEISHYEYKQYENGGVDKIKIIDTPFKPEINIYEDIYVYIEYSEKQKIERRIEELKSLLIKTDYQAIKFAESELSAEEYLPIKQKRRSYRAEINSLEEKLKNFA